MHPVQRAVATAVAILILLSSASGALAKTDKILMVLWRGPTETEAAYREHLAAMGVQARITEITGDQDRARLGTILRDKAEAIQNGEYDLIYSYGTTVTSMVILVANRKAPIVFNIVFDPVGANLVESMERPGGNITGVTNGVPIEDQLNTFSGLRPFKNMVLLFNAREFNSNLVKQRVEEWAASKGVSVTDIRVAPGTDALDKALEDIKSGKVACDMLYAGADSYLASRATDVNEAIGRTVPLFGGTGTFVKYGWLGAYSPTLDDMGKSAAELTRQVLQGRNAGTLPVVLPTPRVIMSGSSAERFGMAIPDGAVVEK